MSKITVLTLHGDSGSGKDSTYLALKEINRMLPRYAFGDQIRKELEAERKYYSDDEREIVNGKSFKDRMIEHGRQMMLVDPYRYTRNTAITIEKLGNINPLVVVTDCRRPCELKVIRSHFPTISVRLRYQKSVWKALDSLLDGDENIFALPEQSIDRNVDYILDLLLRVKPITRNI